MAALAVWQERIGRLLGLKKLAWTAIGPEYDPFKYCSFPVNAGNLAYELTRANRAQLAREAAAGKLGAFPPVLAFQSAVDATVSAPALVRDLLNKLPAQGHELVVFDLNRNSAIEPLLKKDPRSEENLIRKSPDRAFTFSLVVNVSAASQRAEVQTWRPGQAMPQEIDAWPGPGRNPSTRWRMCKPCPSPPAIRFMAGNRRRGVPAFNSELSHCAAKGHASDLSRGYAAAPVEPVLPLSPSSGWCGVVQAGGADPGGG